MAQTKVEKAAHLMMKNPEITNIALAQAVKTPQSAAWTLRRSAEKYIERHNLKAQQKPLELKDETPQPRTQSFTGDFSAMGAKIEVVGDFIQIRIPKKSLGSMLFSNLFH